MLDLQALAFLLWQRLVVRQFADDAGDCPSRIAHRNADEQPDSLSLTEKKLQQRPMGSASQPAGQDPQQLRVAYSGPKQCM